jgi:hypothetical protein
LIVPEGFGTFWSFGGDFAPGIILPYPDDQVG